MYLAKIVLENFQGFERGEFDLSPNLNIIVGVSNVGKSSIARALSLVLYNTWDRSWVRHGSKHCTITLETSTGIVIVREKGDKVNKYTLTMPNEQPRVFESFGTSVPEEIQQALRIHEVQVDTTDRLNLNLASQMDSLFLLSQPGSYRAKVLGKLSGATFLDHAIRELNKDKRRITGEKDSQDLAIIGLKAQVDKLCALEALVEPMASLEARLTSLAAAEQRLERVRSLLGRVNALRDSWTRECSKQEILERFDIEQVNQLIPRVDKIKAIGSLLGNLDNNRLAAIKISKLNDLLSNVDQCVIDKLIGKSAVLKTVKDLAARLDKNKNELVNKAYELKQAEQQHADAAKRYGDMLRDAGVCPMCNRSTHEAEICQ
jgi:DNA repair protein SbcC/Rad50